MLNSAYFTTDSYPAHQRLSAWRGTLERLSLHVRNVAATGAVHGTVSSAVSPQGLTFARISAGPQDLGYQDATRHGAICLSLHLEGEAMLVDESRQTLIDSGDIVFGPTGATGGLSLKSDFRQLLVTIPREAFRSRLPTPLSLKVGRLPGNSGIGHVFSGMLGSVAEKIDQLTIAQLRPIEIALSEFLVSNLTNPEEFVAKGDAACARATLHRISQHIEWRLSDPDLCVDAIAAQFGVSTRYLQKLFESAGETFTHYVRLRRLERCRADLVNPLFAHLSISDVCFAGASATPRISVGPFASSTESRHELTAVKSERRYRPECCCKPIAAGPVGPLERIGAIPTRRGCRRPGAIISLRRAPTRSNRARSSRMPLWRSCPGTSSRSKPRARMCAPA